MFNKVFIVTEKTNSQDKVGSSKKFLKLKQYLKQVEKDYQPKTSKVLARGQVLAFLQKAPTEKYFIEKVILVIAAFRACRGRSLRGCGASMCEI